MSEYETLAYAATPSRLASRVEEILGFVTNQGYACLHPFKALPYEWFEGGLVGREKTLLRCCRLIDISDEFWMFGISIGTLIELRQVLKVNRENAVQKPIRLCLDHDPEWQDWLSELEWEYAPESQIIRHLCS